MQITIRDALIKDAQTIVEAERELAKVPGIFCSSPSELTSLSVIDTISTFTSTQKGVYLVAEWENQIVGHAFLEPLELHSLCHVAQLNLAVHRGWERKGIGTHLLKQLLEWAKNSPTIKKIELHVRATNIPAIALYKKMGFQEEGRLTKRVKVGDDYVDDIIMGLDPKST